MSAVNISETVRGRELGKLSATSVPLEKATRLNTAVLSPGKFVLRDLADFDCRVPALEAELSELIGCVEKAATIELDSNDQYPVQTRVPVVQRTRGMFVNCETVAVEGEPVFVVFQNGGEGDVRNADDGDSGPAPGIRFAETIAGPGIVAVQFDLPSLA